MAETHMPLWAALALDGTEVKIAVTDAALSVVFRPRVKPHCLIYTPCLVAACRCEMLWVPADLG